jgi:uncharacterized protein YfaT (DUF1175 family)
VNANTTPLVAPPAAPTRRWNPRIALGALAALVILLALARLSESAFRRILPRRSAQSISGLAYPAQNRESPLWTDRFDDGTPDFLRLADPADRAAFRRWFTLIAGYQTIRPSSDVPAEIADCASLLRYSYREALKRHDEAWFATTGIEVAAPPGEVRAWNYPRTPLGANLFRIRPGPFHPNDVNDGAFAQFADVKTLVEHNAYFLTRNVRQALPGDLLFYRQFGQSSPWHSMIVTQLGREAAVVYDTGEDHGQAGELRRVALAELLDHPQPQWRPLPSNPNFLGVYRWNILRGTP